MATPHALVLPYPAQGHVIPLMELAHVLVDRGFKVTFLNTAFNYDRVVAAMTKGGAHGGLDRIRLVSIPDSLGPGEDRNDLIRLTVALASMAPRIEELIRQSGKTEDGKITCMVVDYNMAWTLDISRKAGIRGAAIWPASAAVLATILCIPKLMEDHVIGADGSSLSKETFQLCPDMPLIMHTDHLAWNCLGKHDAQELLFRCVLDNIRAVENADFILCNSFHDAEPAVFAYFPKILPVGPLLTGERHGKAVGHFWSPEDAACMSWLDEKPPGSVVYVAFGSFTIFDHRQFEELALGLEMSGRPFLWVVRPGIHSAAAHAYPEGFVDRVGQRGRMVGWSPQQQVLAHPSVACFMSHCGWNSTMEGVRNGVPFLAWPYFADQFVNEGYICDVWKVGLRVVADESGIVRKEHIAARVDELISDAGVRERAAALKKGAHVCVQDGVLRLRTLMCLSKP